VKNGYMIMLTSQTAMDHMKSVSIRGKKNDTTAILYFPVEILSYTSLSYFTMRMWQKYG
jgi:hypothetical protein